MKRVVYALLIAMVLFGCGKRDLGSQVLAKVGNTLFWGLPGHVTSAMVVFHVVVRPFLEHIGGKNPAATSAENSPRLCPATIEGVTPRESSTLEH